MPFISCRRSTPPSRSRSDEASAPVGWNLYPGARRRQGCRLCRAAGCRSRRPKGLRHRAAAAAAGAAPRCRRARTELAQRGGHVNDASCLSRTPVAGVVRVRNEADVATALRYASAHGLTVSAAGVKHSMGGQAFRSGGVVLDMRGMDAIRLDPAARTVTVGSGATWHAIQLAVHPRFAVKAMQSTDIFRRGSISVNAHGMDHQAGAVMGSLRSVRLMLADGRVVTASRDENAELFRHVVGGYGLFGVILSATLDVVPNDVYRSGREIIDYRAFPATFERIAANPASGSAMSTCRPRPAACCARRWCTPTPSIPKIRR